MYIDGEKTESGSWAGIVLRPNCARFLSKKEEYDDDVGFLLRKIRVLS